MLHGISPPDEGLIQYCWMLSNMLEKLNWQKKKWRSFYFIFFSQEVRLHFIFYVFKSIHQQQKYVNKNTFQSISVIKPNWLCFKWSLEWRLTHSWSPYNSLLVMMSGVDGSVISRGIPRMGLNTETKTLNASCHFYVSYCQHMFRKSVHTNVLFPYSQMY